MDSTGKVEVDMSTSKDSPYRFFLSNEEFDNRCIGSDIMSYDEYIEICELIKEEGLM